ncbi:hypothetical protein [Azohydromonas caseinilytica]|uniref:Uncharacterized protein n=1 Tax=Azohydromonas caseinilytica TaxID=2728836 RepID=A0A848FFH0_9BURK|nr:hypothetical protein [Azohydromonas caseinilytica]NML18977.1 hypothetical protein [Azohydromonas caseinilytica]
MAPLVLHLVRQYLLVHECDCAGMSFQRISGVELRYLGCAHIGLADRISKGLFLLLMLDCAGAIGVPIWWLAIYFWQSL